MKATATVPPAKAAMFRLSNFAVQGEFTPLIELEGRDLMLMSVEFPIETKNGACYKMNLIEQSDLGEPIVHQVLTSAVIISRALEAFETACQEGQAGYPVAVRFVKPGKVWLIE